MTTNPNRFSLGQSLTLVQFYRTDKNKSPLPLEDIFVGVHSGKLNHNDIGFKFIDAVVTLRFDYGDGQVGFVADIPSTSTDSDVNWVAYNRYPDYIIDEATADPFTQNRLNCGWDLFEKGFTDIDHHGGLLFDYTYVVEFLSMLESPLVEEVIVVYQLKKGII